MKKESTQHLLRMLLIICCSWGIAACSSAEDTPVEEPEKPVTETPTEPEEEEEEEEETKVYVDFDAEYGTGHTGYKLATKLNEAIADLEEDEYLLLKSASYDLANTNWKIEKPARISGVVPEGDTPDARGAFGLTTSFINVKKIFMRSNNIKIEHLKVVGGSEAFYMMDYRHATDGNTNTGQYYTGHSLFNVRIENSNVQIFLGSGAGIDINHVTCYHFTAIGCASNRKGKNETFPPLSVKNSEFLVDLDLKYYNTRGLSFDAGNTEFSVIWDLDGVVIDNCFFQSGGIGFSRCENAVIRNCEIKGYNLSMDAIHMEEFTNHILIEDNVFEHVYPARGFWIDREVQATSDITIRNNVFKGDIGWIISCYPTHNFTFTGNDFTQASISNSNTVAFDFDYYQDRGKLDLPQTPYSTNMNFSNNTGLENLGKFAINLLEGDTESVIEFPGSKTVNYVAEEEPRFENGNYFIRNKVSGKYIAADDAGGIVLTTNKTNAGVWEFTHKRFFNNILRNKATQNLMEVDRGYTLSDIQKEQYDPIEVYQKNKWNNGKRQPHFYFVKYTRDGTDYYMIHPGGNEHKSRFVQKNDKVMLNPRYHDDNNRIVPSEDAELWEVIKQ